MASHTFGVLRSAAAMNDSTEIRISLSKYEWMTTIAKSESEPAKPGDCSWNSAM